MSLDDDTDTPTDPAEDSSLISVHDSAQLFGCYPCFPWHAQDIIRFQDWAAELDVIERQSYSDRVAHNQVHDPLICVAPEIVSSIFRFAIGYDYASANSINSYYLESLVCFIRPIWLSSVCARWRRIALGDPSLWTIINIAYRTERTRLGRYRGCISSSELVEKWMSRSGTLPLRITLTWTKAPESEDETLQRIIEALCKQCSRWRGLYAQVPAEAMRHFQSAASERIIDLDYLLIDHYYAGNHPLSVGHTTLRPRHVSLHSPPWVTESFSWINTVYLKITDARLDESLEIIIHASQLEELHLTLRRPGFEGKVPALATPIIASRLRKMWIASFDIEDLEEFFMFILAPELESLELFGSPNTATHVSFDFLDALLLHSGNKLRKLSTVRLTFSANDLLNLLSGLDHLSYLLIDFVDNDDNMVASLEPLFNRLSQTSPENPVSFLPQLSQFYYSGPRTFTWSCFFDVIHAHYAAAHSPNQRPLQLLSPMVPPIVPDNVIDRETLVRLLALQTPEINMKFGINEDLIKASLEHHGLDGDTPLPLLFRPTQL